MNDPINDDNFNFTEQREAQLTAYALGELDEQERALVERRLENDADARAIVAQVRELATTLTSELAAEPMPRLSGPQREALRAENPARVNGISKLRTVPLRTRLWFGAGLAAAACLAIAVTTFNLSDSMNASRARIADRVVLGLPVEEVQGRADGRGQSAGQPGSGELYAFGKQASNESTDFKRQAGRELLLDQADKLAAAETAAGARPAPGAPASETYRAPMQSAPSAGAGLESPPIPPASSVQLGQELARRKSEEQVLRQPLGQMGSGQAPPAPVEPRAFGGESTASQPPAASPSMWPVDKTKDAERVLSVTGAAISPVEEGASVLAAKASAEGAEG